MAGPPVLAPSRLLLPLLLLLPPLPSLARPSAFTSPAPRPPLPPAPASAPETAAAGAGDGAGGRGRRLAPPVDAPALSNLVLLLASLGAERRAPVFWDYTKIRYSLTVPSEAVAAALVATVASDYEAEVELVLHMPDGAGALALDSGSPSPFADVPTEEATKFVLEVRLGSKFTNYTVAVLRSTISSSYQFVYPDPAEAAPPAATLVGLQVFNTFGSPAKLNPYYFMPQRSQYIASLDFGIDWAWVVASKNDPDATLEMRVNGQDWLPLESGIGCPLQPVPNTGWLLVEVKVSSAIAAAAGVASLVYQVVIAHQAICHERCRSCYGPGEEQCLRCRSPLVLFEGRCEKTSCPSNGYYEWQSYQCRRCHASCAQCRGPGALACSLCPALAFLAPTKWEDLQGPCVMTCPVGTFAHPKSRRCRVPPSTVVKAFYVRFTFREPAASAMQDTRLQGSIINTTAFVLGLSLSDIRPYKITAATAGRLQMTIEAVSPFLPKADADRVTIDTWFGAFEVPVDEVTTHTWDELHPPLPKLPPEPFLPVWVYGLIVSGGVTLLILLPLYFFYFRRLSNTTKRYRTRGGIDPMFVNDVVQESPAYLVRRFMANHEGNKGMMDSMD